MKKTLEIINLYIFLICFFYVLPVKGNESALTPITSLETIDSFSEYTAQTGVPRILPPRDEESFLHEPLISGNLHLENTEETLLLEWLDSCVFGSAQQNKCIRNMLFGIELYSGFGRGASYFRLGYNLSSRFFSEDMPGSYVLSSIYGTAVFMPMAALGTRLTGNLLRWLFNKKSPLEKKLEIEESCLAKVGKYIIKAPIISTGIISGPPLTYMSYDLLNDWLGWGWLLAGVPTFYTRTIVDYYAITTISTMLADSTNSFLKRSRFASGPSDRTRHLLNIDKKLSQAKNIISSLNYYQAKTLLDRLNFEPNTLRKISILSTPESFIEGSINLKKHGITRNVIGLIGGLIGNYGTWVCYPIAEDSFQKILSILNIEEKNSLVSSLATISTLTVSSLPTLAAISSFQKFYDASVYLCGSKNSIDIHMMDKKFQRFRCGLIVASTILAIFSASTQIELVLEFLDINQPWALFGLFAALTASFATSFWSVDELLLEFLKTSDPRAPTLGKIDKIQKQAHVMPDIYLESLENIFNKSDSEVELINIAS